MLHIIKAKPKQYSLHYVVISKTSFVLSEVLPEIFRYSFQNKADMKLLLYYTDKLLSLLQPVFLKNVKTLNNI